MGNEKAKNTALRALPFRPGVGQPRNWIGEPKPGRARVHSCRKDVQGKCGFSPWAHSAGQPQRL